MAASHYLLLSHGRAVEVLRGVAPRAEVGIALNLEHSWAATDRDDDHEAVRWWDGTRSRWYLDPLFGGQYPPDVLQEWEHLMPAGHEGDLACIAAPIDFLGVNNYTASAIGVGSATVSQPERCRSQGRPGPTWAGRSTRTACARCWSGSLTITAPRPFTSPRTVPPSPMWSTTKAASSTPNASSTWRPTLPPRPSGPGGSAAEGLFRLGSHGQLRVELGCWKRFGLVYVDYRPRGGHQRPVSLVPRLHRRSASLWPTDGCAEAVATASRPLVSRGCAGGAGLGRDSGRETSVLVQHQTRPRRR